MKCCNKEQKQNCTHKVSLSDKGFHHLKVITFIQLNWSDMHSENKLQFIQRDMVPYFLVNLPNILFANEIRLIS